MQQPQFAKRFIFWSVLTVSSIYLLILVGGIVRATGSGMGCPDWPKCFGKWVPPTELRQLPADYKQVYLAQRVAKNQKLARTLASLGFRQVAGEIFAHPTQYVETDFNATKTWIEYLNRLLGALIGIFVFVNAAVALPYWRRDRPIVWLAVAGWLLTGVQGWLGSLVVSTNLLPIMVTIHMGLALLIVAILLYAVQRARWGKAREKAGAVQLAKVDVSAQQGLTPVSAGMHWMLWAVLLLTFWQIIMGTQVREEIDRIASAADYGRRDTWVAALGGIFEAHRTLAAIVVLANVVVGYRLWVLAILPLRRLVAATWVVLALEMMAGITLAYWALPAFIQPIHLTLATLLFGTQFLTLLAVRPRGGVGSRLPVVQQPHSYHA